MAKKPAADPILRWRQTIDRVCRQAATPQGRRIAGLHSRHLDGLPSNHPSIKDVAPDLRAEWSDRLRKAAKGA
ncbi:hypothetical protein [Brevundimonas aurantiaca]|uniref:hypothetical protein n=1 Tax=Brevundimonas aurantiaca TaxID=74316 RepID=UPI003019D973